MDKLNREDLERLSKPEQNPVSWIKVGMSSCGIAAGAEEVFAALQEEARKRNVQIAIKKCGCLGMCYAEPLVEVGIEGMPAVIYGRVNKEVAAQIFEKHVLDGILVNDHIFDLNSK